jgi:hypothetical protein
MRTWNDRRNNPAWSRTRSTGQPSLRRSTAGIAGVAFLSVTALIALRTFWLLNVPGDPAMDDTHWALCDFRDAVYYPAVSFLQGGNPYGASFPRTYPVGSALAPYLPLTLLVHLPFGLMPFTIAEAVHFLLAVALTLVLACLALEVAGLARTTARVLALGTLLLVSRPGHWNLVLGQPTLLVAIGTYLALRWSDDRPWLAAFAFALALVKPSFGLPLGVVMFARGNGGVVVAGTLIAASISAAVVEILVVHAGGATPFLADTLSGFALWNTALDPFVNKVAFYGAMDVGALLSRPLGRALVPAEQLGVAGAILGFAALAIRRLGARPEPAARVRSLALACLAVVLAVHHQTYDWLLLAPAVTAAATTGGRLEPAGHVLLRFVLLVLLSVPALNYLAASTALVALGITGPLAVLVCSANGAALTSALALAGGAALAEPAAV